MKNSLRFQAVMGICLLIFVLAGCKVKRPDDVISEKKMEDLLYDYHIAKAMGDNVPYNENYKKALYIDAVFHKHGTTEAVFDSSMVWYTRNTETLSKIYEKVNKRLKAQRDEINHLIAIRDKKPETSAQGDSVDVWYWQRLVRLTNMPASNKYTFVLPADTNFKARDTLVWEIDYRFPTVLPDTARTAIMAMQIVYENDSIVSEIKELMNSGKENIRLQGDTLGMLKEVKGFIYFVKSKDPATLLIDNISLMRYHCTDTLSSAARDSLNAAEALKADSLKQMTSSQPKTQPDTVQAKHMLQQRLTPEEMNRKRTNRLRPVKAEQLETEQKILIEKDQIKQEQPVRSRRNHRLRQQIPEKK